MREARAVRKAVRELAWRMPRGLPCGVKRVMAPVGRMVGFADAVAATSVAEVRDTTIQGVASVHPSQWDKI